MVYQTYIPRAELSRFVKCYWSLETDQPAQAGQRDRIFPDGCIELVFHYGDLFKKYSGGHSPEIQQRCFIHGQLTGYMELEPMGKAGIFSVRFHPHGLGSFIPFESSALTGLTAGLKDIWGKPGEELEDRMLWARTNAERLQILEKFLMSRLEARYESSLMMEYCINAILQSKGTLSVDELARNMAVGRRQLERKFSAGVGISPKLLSRIVRFQNTLKLIERKQFSSLTMVAYEGGFYDQAHFIKDFKVFTGLNPKQYFSEKLEIAKYLSND